MLFIISVPRIFQNKRFEKDKSEKLMIFEYNEDEIL
jgi:hypothetical protein